MLTHGMPKPLKTVIRDYNKYLWENGHGEDRKEVSQFGHTTANSYPQTPPQYHYS